ncbi:MAG TPA: chemotaxis protein CheW [Gammaproteobacteria bacterium]|nr:chemotaxis protein CheW [Gammaproteobacteria bacterium]
MNEPGNKSARPVCQQTLPEPQDALYAYLDALLQEVPDEQSRAVNLVTPAAQQQALDTPPQPVEEKTAVVEAVAAETVVNAEAADVPEWAQQSFQSLMFSVTGLHLSVPLDKLSGVIPWNSDHIVPMPGHSENFLGLLRHLGQNVKVIDLARLVVPQNGGPDIVPAADRVKHILLIDDGRWGLACDSINEILVLEAQDVRWRTCAGKRAWLAGTIIDKLCALLELDALVKLLESGKEQA